MPYYDYRCEECAEQFELFQSMDAPSGGVCPKCQSHLVKRIIGGAGIIFKGSDFYVTQQRQKRGQD
ncbi:FmdB family zinc ribbon protein [Entomospira culicis]|uniref:Zinc ribbon domain-containing protein n=1 Tax=Entomospira culicis TaxID=2719989 RepID=A0A968GFK8_9SPIO|nr:zinc ribbon domain-containing protein [Entomospira culicis]NIZ19409.1 zinc ribbon domain-containing protein [Entomospira culicis]NIZ69686.1 zinc ribbon domain-containing protein [Entomospira culicis]WDI36796.1 zinc ribbon domain-containing protein [Entomospira culicis]WDI38425.1 zinc ribbon domain-containing protein [Entomospira culicis]